MPSPSSLPRHHFEDDIVANIGDMLISRLCAPSRHFNSFFLEAAIRRRHQHFTRRAAATLPLCARQFGRHFDYIDFTRK